MSNEQQQEPPAIIAGRHNELSDEDLLARLTKAQERNYKIAKRCERGTPPMGVDVISMTQNRLEFFIEAVLPTGTRQRAEFELCWNDDVVTPSMDALSAAQREANIMDGAPQSARHSGLVLP